MDLPRKTRLTKVKVASTQNNANKVKNTHKPLEWFSIICVSTHVISTPKNKLPVSPKNNFALGKLNGKKAKHAAITHHSHVLIIGDKEKSSRNHSNADNINSACNTASPLIPSIKLVRLTIQMSPNKNITAKITNITPLT